MRRLRAWLRRLAGTFFPSRRDLDFVAELESHVAMHVQDGVSAGMSPDEARRQALLALGGVQATREAYRAQLGISALASVLQDLRYGARLLANNPGFALVCIVSLAIGVGANCAVFSFADALLLRPLTVPRPDEVVTVGSREPFFNALVASYREYIDIRNRNTSFDGLVAFTSTSAGFAAQPDALPELTLGMVVSGNLFKVMGVEPELGRTFRPEEDQAPGRDAVVILGHDFWERQFGGDVSVLGRTVRMNGIEFTVVGVAPADFAGLDQYVRFDFYVPLTMWPQLANNSSLRPLETRDLRSLTVKGRLKPGISVAAAQTELSAVSRDLERAYPDTSRNRRFVVRTELQSRFAQNPPSVTLVAMLTALAAAVLFVACANVAGLLTSRAPARAREFALRLAIGAGRMRLIRQLITESVLLAGLGGLAGVGVGYLGVTMFRRFRLPTDLPTVPAFNLDRRALFVGLAATLVSVVAFGLAPAVRSTRADLTAAMKANDAAGLGRRRRWGRALLVGGQVAVSVVVLVIATFMYRSFLSLIESGPGYRTEHLLMMSFNPSLVRYTEPQARRFFEQVAQRARSVPGVKSVAMASVVPMDLNLARTTRILPEGFQFPAGQETALIPTASIGEGYFETIGVPILKGRGIGAADAADAPRVAVVNERAAQHYWPAQDPLGKRFRLNDDKGPWVEVVGVATNSKYFWLGETPNEFLYVPYTQQPQQRMVLLAQSASDPASLVPTLREAVRRLDANQPIFDVRTMDEFFRMRMLTLFNIVIGFVAAMGLMGLSLAIVGLYGLVAYAVSRRTREIGIRMAIGADRSCVLRMVVRQGVVLALAGLGVGLLASAGVGRALAWTIPGSSNARGFDVISFSIVAVVVLSVTLFAAYIPARRATRIDPIQALRDE